MRAGKGFKLFILDEDMIDPGILIDGVTKTVKHEIKNKEAHFLELY